MHCHLFAISFVCSFSFQKPLLDKPLSRNTFVPSSVNIIMQPDDYPTTTATLDSQGEEGITVPTETYRLSTDTGNDGSDINDMENEAVKLLPQAFASLASATTVRLGIDHDEEMLFDTLINTTEAYERGDIQLEEEDFGETHIADNQNGKSAGPLQVRVAGGWVRDKLLGLQTHDVDITLNKLTGVPFAKLIQKYLTSLPPTHPARCQTKYPKIGVIAANPAQSKHLETATMKVHNIDIDICHLRSEEIYEEHSRIPTASIGTPYEDAMRRDFTINSLFYNLHTKQVEDWTRRGMDDLRHKRLVTPLDAETTFIDDPLRVLRAIRFSVRYQLDLDEGLETACQLRKIHKALQVKVSRERIGKELEGMLSGKGANPQRALATIARLKLAGCVFCFPSTGDMLNKTQITNHAEGEILGHIYRGEHDDLNHLREMGWEESQRLLEFLPRLHQLYHQLPQTATAVDKRLLPLAVFLLPFRNLNYEEKKQGNLNSPGKQHAVTTFMFRESIKFKNKDVQGIQTIMENVDPMAKFLTDLSEQQKAKGTEEAHDALQVCRLEAGLVLRATKDLWVTTLLLACLVKLREQELDTTTANSIDWFKLTASAYRTIVGLNLEECWKAKPLLNGKAVIDALKLPRGPLISSYLEEQTRWMLLNPEGTKEECEQHLHSIKRRRDLEESGNNSDGGNMGQPQPPHPRLK